MQLLTPTNLQQIRDRDARERQQRILKLADEETRLCKSINQLQDQEKTERARVEQTIANLQKTLTSEVNALKKEVFALEERRAEALKPVKLAMDEATAQMRASQMDREEANRTLADAKNTLNAADLLKEQNDSRSNALDEYEVSIKNREHVVSTRENALKTSLKTLQDKENALNEDISRMKVLEKALMDAKQEALDIVNAAHEEEARILNEAEAIRTSARTYEIRMINKQKEMGMIK